MFGAEARVLQQVDTRDSAAGSAQRQLARRGSLVQAAGFLCAQAAILAMLLGAADRPVFAAGAVFLLVAAFEVAGGLPRAGALAGNAATAAARVLDAARPAPGLPEPANPAALPTGTALRLEGVQFGWSPDRPRVFDGLTMDIPQGARVAVLGPSGSGKSTLTALLLKVAAPQSGRILIGGTDIATCSTVPAERHCSPVSFLVCSYRFPHSDRESSAAGCARLP